MRPTSRRSTRQATRAISTTRLWLAEPGRSTRVAEHLLDDTQKPLVDATVVVTTAGQHYRQSTACRTEMDGRFVVSLGARDDENLPASVEFTWSRPEQPTLRAELPNFTPRAGTQDVGDVVLEVGQHIAAGHLVANGHPFTEPINIWLQRFDAAAQDEDERWTGVDRALTFVAKDGSFLAHGKIESYRYRLVFAGETIRPLEPLEFAAGTEDLVIEVEPGEAIAASLLLPDQAAMDMLTIELVASATAAGQAPERHAAYPQLMQGTRFGVQWLGLPAGSYALEVSNWIDAEPVLRVPDITLPRPPGGDARLVDLDLQALLRVVTLRVFDPDGKPLSDGEGAVFRGGLCLEETWPGAPFYGGTLSRLLLRKEPVDLLVAVAGYRPMPARCTGPELAVRLEHWPAIEVLLADRPELPPDVQIHVHSEVAGREQRSWRTPWWEDSRDSMTGGLGQSVPFRGTRATIRCTDGPQRLVVTVIGEAGTCELKGITPSRFTPDVGQVTLRAPAAEWQRAFAAVVEPK